MNTGADFLNWRNLPLDYKVTHWGGEPAADLLTGNLNPEILTLYTTEDRMDIIKKYRLIPDNKGKILIRQFWKDKEEYKPTVPALLVYADLALQNDNRLIETAQKVYNEYLQANL